MALIGLFLFILIPIIEIATIINVGQLIGIWPTIAIIILTAVIGVHLLRRQGLALFTTAHNEFQKGKLPINSLFDAMGIGFAGALLLTPGFITDLFGLSLFIPPWRQFLMRKISNRFFIFGEWSGSEQNTCHYDCGEDGPGKPRPNETGDPTIIEGDFTRIKETDKSDKTTAKSNKSSPWGQN